VGWVSRDRLVDGLRIRSRRGWDMSGLLPELSELPRGLVLDGELVAFGDDASRTFRCRVAGYSTVSAASPSCSWCLTSLLTIGEAAWSGRTGKAPAARQAGSCESVVVRAGSFS
jgi:hypothetical protein